jgi:hypothetical protein
LHIFGERRDDGSVESISSDSVAAASGAAAREHRS